MGVVVASGEGVEEWAEVVWGWWGWMMVAVYDGVMVVVAGCGARTEGVEGG